jgi:Fe-S-cluster containining protein
MAGATPKFYQHWLRRKKEDPDDLGSFDCTACFMTKPKGLTRDLGPFDPTLKCCTFHPFLPSFTIGALLRDESNQVLTDYLVASRLTPLGAFPRVAPTSVCETGKIAETRCAFLSTDGRANCTIRDFRPSTCAGYVCRSRHGVSGLKAWREWESKIAKFEWSLTHLIAFELGYVLSDVESGFSSVEEAKGYYRRAYELSGDIPYIED